MQLNIPAGSAVRFEPGEGRRLVTFGGKRNAFGINDLANSSTLTERA